MAATTLLVCRTVADTSRSRCGPSRPTARSMVDRPRPAISSSVCHLVEVQPHAAVLLSKCRQRVADGHEQSRVAEGEPYFADLAAFGHQREVGGALDLAQDEARLLQKRLARIGKGNAALGAVEQLHAELCFQAFDLEAQRRLRHVEADGSTAEVQLFRYGDEVTQVA